MTTRMCVCGVREWRGIGVHFSSDFSQVTLNKSINPPFLASISWCKMEKI